MMYVVAAMAVLMAFESWCLWRVLDRLGVVGRIEDRLATLAHSMALLTDTTETCFQVIAGQLDQERPSQAAGPAERATRQRRVVGAARRGRSVTDIAVDEELAESEVRLRLHLARQKTDSERGRHGSVLT
jgi:DNA-binding NarL/FixJ family response regulator